MNENIWSKFGLAITTSALTFLVFLLQNNFNRKQSAKEKLSILSKLLAEAINECKQQILFFKWAKEEIDKNYQWIPPLLSSTLSSLDQTNTRLLSDEYFSAFARLLRDVIDSEKIFFEIKADISFLQLSLNNLAQNYESSYAKFQETRSSYYRSFYEMKKNYVVLYERLKNTDDYRNIKAIYNIFYNNHLICVNLNERSDLKKLEQKVIDPILFLINAIQNDLAKDLKDKLVDLKNQKGELDISNIDVAVKLASKFSLLDSAVCRLETKYSEFTNQQVQNRWR